MELFSGLENGHGTYNPQVTDAKGKLVGHAEFIHEPATLTTWINHVKGDLGVGMGPINNSSQCRWGAIDIDDYNINHSKLIKKIIELKFPLICVKSKSGGAHLMMFMTDWVPAELVKDRLTEMAAALGHAYGKNNKPTEVFPRQSTILSDRGDCGNWLNIPYFGGDDSNRYALDENAERLSTEKFIEVANKSKITEDQLKALDVAAVQLTKSEFADAPFCLGQICEEGSVLEGNRNIFMYNMGVLAQKIHPHNREERNALMERWNQELCDPALSAKEICDLQSSLDKHPDYKYQCKESLLRSYCNNAICKTRKHGLSGACHMPALADLTRLNSSPAIFFLQVNNVRVEFADVNELIQQPRFQACCVEQANVMPPTLKKSEWTDLINQLLEDVRIIEASPDASIEAKLEELLESFAEQMSAGLDRQDITRGLPWFDKKTQKTVFKLHALESFLANNKFRQMSRGQLINKLKSWGGESKQIKINGKNHNVWQLTIDNIANKVFDIELKTEKDIL